MYLQAILLVMKTRYDRYRLIMTPLYRFDNSHVRIYDKCHMSFDDNIFQDDLEAELLESPEREPVSGGKTRRNFGTCHDTGPTTTRPELNLMEWLLWSVPSLFSVVNLLSLQHIIWYHSKVVLNIFQLSLFIYSNRKYTYCFNVFGISAWTRNVSSLLRQMFLTARREISFNVFVLKWFCFSHNWDSSLSNSLWT